MFNLFKTKQHANESASGYPAIVTQIHNEFRLEGDRLLQEAQLMLEVCAATDKEKGILLNKIGFKQVPQAKQINELIEKETQAKKTAELIKYYSVEYPFSRFITNEGVNRICQKYGLVCGGIEIYTGFVPLEKLKAIADFKIKEKDDGVMLGDQFLKGGYVKQHGKYYHVFHKNKKDEFMWAFQSNDGKRFYGNDFFNLFGLKEKEKERIYLDYTGNNLHICAPLKDMNMDGKQLKGFRIIDIPIPDPVVLKPVEGGYLIIAAWGDEASDPIVTNTINN